jgi:hypothetical protein
LSRRDKPAVLRPSRTEVANLGHRGDTNRAWIGACARSWHTGSCGVPRTSRELWPLAQRARLSRRTLRRARGDLNIRCVRVCAEGKRLSYWLLPGQQLPSGLSPESATPELDEYLARLNEQFPRSTPLDDL